MEQFWFIFVEEPTQVLALTLIHNQAMLQRSSQDFNQNKYYPYIGIVIFISLT